MRFSSLLISLVLILPPITVFAQARPATQVIRLGTAAAQGIDQSRLDSVYVDGFGRNCAHCRFDSTRTADFRESWDRLLNQLMEQCVEQKVAFTEIVLRAYFGSDGALDYVLYYAGEDPVVDARFVLAVRAVAETFRFAPAEGPFKQSATITLGG